VGCRRVGGGGVSSVSSATCIVVTPGSSSSIVLHAYAHRHQCISCHTLLWQTTCRTSQLALSVLVRFLAACMSSIATYPEEKRFVERSSVLQRCLRVICRRSDMVLPCVKYVSDECTRSECASLNGAQERCLRRSVQALPFGKREIWG
jgi:hypothetical protein